MQYRRFIPMIAAACLMAGNLEAVAQTDTDADDHAGHGHTLTDPAEDSRGASAEERKRAGRPSATPREQAIDALKLEAEQNPDDPALQFKLANLYHDAGYLNLALQHHKRALALNDGDSRVWVNLGVVQRELNRREDALESFQNAIRVNPGDPLAHVNLGDELLWTKQYQKAVDAYRTALASDDRCAPAYYSLAITFAETGMYQDAARLWKKCAEVTEADQGTDGDTYKRAVENARLMEEILADARTELEERQKLEKEAASKKKSD